MGTPLAASMIRRATSFACDSMGTWLDATVIVFAPIVFANSRGPVDHPVVGGDHLPGRLRLPCGIGDLGPEGRAIRGTLRRSENPALRFRQVLREILLGALVVIFRKPPRAEGPCRGRGRPGAHRARTRRRKSARRPSDRRGLGVDGAAVG